MTLSFTLDDLEVREPDPEVLLGFLADMEFRTVTKRIADKLGVKAPEIEVTAAAAEVDDVRLSIGSGWFLARGTAELDGRVLSRRTVLARHPLPVGVLVDYRLPDD